MKFLLLIMMLFSINGYADISKIEKTLSTKIHTTTEEIEHIKLLSAFSNIPIELVYSVIFVESTFKRNAKSNKGAIGYFQIMPIAEKCINQRYNVKLDRRIPMENIEIGILFLGYLSHKYNNNYVEVLQHYYGGYRRTSETLAYYNKVAKVYNKLIEV